MCRWINPRSLPFQPPNAAGATSYARRVAINLKPMRGQWLQTPRPSRSILSEKSSWDPWHGCIHERLAETASRAACWQTRWAMAKQPPPLGCYLRSRAKCQMSGQVGTLGQGGGMQHCILETCSNIIQLQIVANDSVNWSRWVFEGIFHHPFHHPFQNFNACQESSNIDPVSPSLGRAVGRRILQVSGWRSAAVSPVFTAGKTEEAVGSLTTFHASHYCESLWFKGRLMEIHTLFQLTVAYCRSLDNQKNNTLVWAEHWGTSAHPFYGLPAVHRAWSSGFGA